MICHGIPDDRPLQEGDIVNLDVSVYYKGMHSDLNETFCVGKVSESSLSLVNIQYFRSLKANTRLKIHTDAWKKPLRYVSQEQCTEMLEMLLKNMLRHAGRIIKLLDNDYICRLSVVRSYTGHGVGKFFHCAPTIPHYGNNKTSGFMKVNMTIRLFLY